MNTPGLPLPAATHRAVTPESKAEIEPSVAGALTAAPWLGRAFEERLPSWLLRAGLSFVLSYAATSSMVHPETFAGYFPSFMPDTWATDLLPVFAVFEALLAIGLMTHRYTYVASILAGLTMVAIIAANPHAFNVLFRNVAIACGAFALAVQSRRERGRFEPAETVGGRSGEAHSGHGAGGRSREAVPETTPEPSGAMESR